MTSKLEQEFFEEMGVPCKKEVNQIGNTLGLCNTTIKCIYPPITDTIVLRLIQIILLTNDDYNFSVEHICDEARFLFCEKRIILENEETLKDCILVSCIQLKDEIREEVKQLF